VTDGAASATSASLRGTAAVTLATANSCGLPAGPSARDVPLTATAIAGAPGAGHLDLQVLGMDSPGTVEHRQITVTP
jgi:hypothetical protein